jgi:glycosyltransferase involved in cell wall biosynthesis
LPDASIVIVTKNRKDDLRAALRSAVDQTADIEVIVIDDGSSDGTQTMVCEEFPQVRFYRSEESQGYIGQRNRGAELAKAPIIISIDDDARFSSADAVRQALEDFDHPRIGVATIPYIEAPLGPELIQAPPMRNGTYVTDRFVGTAHALRRDLFLTLGGYRSIYRHLFEEPDYCFRMLDAGYVTRLGRADHIVHAESPVRDRSHNLQLAVRNNLLLVMLNVPTPYLPYRLLSVSLHGIRWGLRIRRLRLLIYGLFLGLRDGVRARAARRPVRRSVYRVLRQLEKRGPVPLEQLEPHLPPMAAWPEPRSH